MASADLRYELTCSICMDVYMDPVTLMCGHSFCQICIGDKLESQKRSGSKVYACPECRMQFQECPTLTRNDELHEKARGFLDIHPKRIFCTYCIQAPELAAKTCLLCEASLCENHLRVHSQSAEHILIKPTTSFCNRKCPVHKKVLEYFCSDEGLCICVSCTLAGDHKDHQVDTLLRASQKKKERLRSILEKLKSVRDETEKRVRCMTEYKKEVVHKVARVTGQVTDLIRNIKEQLEALEIRVLAEISRQEEKISLRLSDLIRQLETKKEDLSSKMDHIQELCNTTDPLTVLQRRERDDYYDSHNGDGSHAVEDLDMGLILVTLNMGLADSINGTWRMHTMLSVDLDTDILLDIKTAGNDTDISSDLKTIVRRSTTLIRPDVRERFLSPQVLSSEFFASGRLYWEVETSESTNWRVGMAYRSTDRKGDQSWLGDNNKSWGLERWNNQYSVLHHCQEIHLPHKPSCNMLGIYLDWEAGRLSFYEQGTPTRHLHTFNVTFTEPLHVLLCVGVDTWLRIVR